ncbi:hypothetical protein [Methanolapillus ohkumae]|uniref:Uncharacterized protein n=1 Tax=Methanolapillus ohkumae TaxID=3028298 RepID=A0AA96VJN0_9EURY|nr:hypothetical protein MsAm2_14350 [Methanosarcinaceae archaeon Am2]
MNHEKKERIMVLSFFGIAFLLLHLYDTYVMDIAGNSVDMLVISWAVLPFILVVPQISILWKCLFILLSMFLFAFYFMDADWYPKIQLATILLIFLSFIGFVLYEGWYRKKFKIWG